jgi:hypothetical protein
LLGSGKNILYEMFFFPSFRYAVPEQSRSGGESTVDTCCWFVSESRVIVSTFALELFLIAFATSVCAVDELHSGTSVSKAWACESEFVEFPAPCKLPIPKTTAIKTTITTPIRNHGEDFFCQEMPFLPLIVFIRNNTLFVNLGQFL